MEPLQQILNFHPMNERVGSAGQPSREQFNIIKQAGFQLIINLALPESPNAIPDEADVVNRLGMEYLHIPVDFNAPAIGELQQFFTVMEKNRDKPVFVHCACNWRVSVFLFLYRTIRLRDPVTEAINDLQAVWKPDPVWQAFITSSFEHFDIHQ